MARSGHQGLFSGLTRNTVFLALASLFADMATEMLYPVLPIYLTQTLKAGGAAVGLVEGVAEGTQNVVQGFAGSLSDRLKRRKSIALVGYAIAALSKPLIGISSSWPGVLGARFADRLGTGIRSAPRDALIASSADEAHRGKAFGLEGVGDNAGAFIGPLLAILLLVGLRVDLRWIFYLAVVPGLLAFVMILLVEERPAALVSYPVGALSDRLGRRNLIVAALVIFFVSYLGFAVTRNVVLVGLLFALYGLYQGMFRAVGKAFASDLAPAALRASGVGWYGATVGLTGLVASAVAGQLWDRIGHAAVFVYGATTAVIGALALILLVRPPDAEASAAT